MLYCPKCGAEYREGYSSCSDCDVLLVRERPVAANSERPPEPGDPNRDPFCSFWKGTDARVLAELCTVLDEARIPHKTVSREDRLFNRMDQPRLELGVPASLYEKAEQAVGDAFSTQPLLRDTDGLVPESLQKSLDFDQDEPSLELADAPLGEVRTKDSPAAFVGERYSEDATAEVWAGAAQDVIEMIDLSLRENEIRTRWETTARASTAFVLPEDEARAREIIREILEGSPPE